MFRQVIGPVLTLVVVLITYLASAYVSVSFGFAHAAVVLTAYIASPISTVVSLVIVVTSIFITYSPDWSRTIQAAVSVAASGAMVILLKRRAALSESLNGNVNRLREALGITRNLLAQWNDFSEQGRKRQVLLIEDKLGNLTTLVYGWHKIHQEIEETKAAEMDNDGTKQPPADIC